MHNELISVVTPCFNAQTWIRECVESVLSQDHAAVEMIVIDDGSTDATLGILKEYGERVRLITGPRRGACAARNTGLDASRGRAIKFLDADDLLSPNILGRQWLCLSKEGLQCCYSDYSDLLDGESGAGKTSLKVLGDQKDVLTALLSDWWGPPLIYLHDRDWLETCGCRWDETLSSAQDFDFALGVALSGAKFGYSEGNAGFYRQHEGERVSRRPQSEWVADRIYLLDKAYVRMREAGSLTEERIRAFCNYYLFLAKYIYNADKDMFRTLIGKIRDLSSTYEPPGKVYGLLVKWFGFESTEAVLEVRRRLLRTR